MAGSHIDHHLAFLRRLLFLPQKLRDRQVVAADIPGNQQIRSRPRRERLSAGLYVGSIHDGILEPTGGEPHAAPDRNGHQSRMQRRLRIQLPGWTRRLLALASLQRRQRVCTIDGLASKRGCIGQLVAPRRARQSDGPMVHLLPTGQHSGQKLRYPDVGHRQCRLVILGRFLGHVGRLGAVLDLRARQTRGCGPTGHGRRSGGEVE